MFSVYCGHCQMPGASCRLEQRVMASAAQTTAIMKRFKLADLALYHRDRFDVHGSIHAPPTTGRQCMLAYHEEVCHMAQSLHAGRHKCCFGYTQAARQYQHVQGREVCSARNETGQLAPCATPGQGSRTYANKASSWKAKRMN